MYHRMLNHADGLKVSHKFQTNNNVSNEYLIPNEVLTMKLIMQGSVAETRVHFLSFLERNWDKVSSTFTVSQRGSSEFLFYLSHSYDSSAIFAKIPMIISCILDNLLCSSPFCIWHCLWYVQWYSIENWPRFCTKNSKILVCVPETCHTVFKACLSGHASCHISFWQERIWNKRFLYVNQRQSITSKCNSELQFDILGWVVMWHGWMLHAFSDHSNKQGEAIIILAAFTSSTYWWWKWAGLRPFWMKVKKKISYILAKVHIPFTAIFLPAHLFTLLFRRRGADCSMQTTLPEPSKSTA